MSKSYLYPMETALDIIKKERGEPFDPEVVDVFLKNINEIIAIKKEVDSEDNIIVSDFKWSERDQS